MHVMLKLLRVQRQARGRGIVRGSNDINDGSGIWRKQKSRKWRWEQFKQWYMIKGEGERGDYGG